MFTLIFNKYLTPEKCIKLYGDNFTICLHIIINNKIIYMNSYKLTLLTVNKVIFQISKDSNIPNIYPYIRMIIVFYLHNCTNINLYSFYLYFFYQINLPITSKLLDTTNSFYPYNIYDITPTIFELILRDKIEPLFKNINKKIFCYYYYLKFQNNFYFERKLLTLVLNY